jgi:hypothetical protein
MRCHRAIGSVDLRIVEERDFHDAEAWSCQELGKLGRRRGNLVALNRGPLCRPMGI